jgi:hypothetical protein
VKKVPIRRITIEIRHKNINKAQVNYSNLVALSNNFDRLIE